MFRFNGLTDLNVIWRVISNYMHKHAYAIFVTEKEMEELFQIYYFFNN